MICETCNGKGRILARTLFGQGNNPPLELDEIGPCPECFGTGEVSCCEGTPRDQVMLTVTLELNPNEVG